MIPYMEKALRAYLQGAAEVSEIVGDRVATKKPGTLTEPWVQIRIYDDPPAGKSSVDHNIAFYVQIDCYAGTEGSQGEANLLARTVRSLLDEMASHEHEGMVVSGAKPAGSRSLPDPAFEPPMDRYLVTGTIWAHSVEGS